MLRKEFRAVIAETYHQMDLMSEVYNPYGWVLQSLHGVFSKVVFAELVNSTSPIWAKYQFRRAFNYFNAFPFESETSGWYGELSRENFETRALCLLNFERFCLEHKTYKYFATKK